MSSNFYNNVGQAKINYIYNTTGVNKLLSNLDAFSMWSATASGITITLPDPSTTFAGWSVKIKNDSTGQITVSGGGFNIDGVASIVLNTKDMVEIVNDGTAVNSIISKYTYAATRRLFSFGSTNIVDGQPSYARTNVFSSITILNFADDDSMFAQVRMPLDYVPGTPLTFIIDYAQTNTVTGDFVWYLYWGLVDGDTIQAAPTPPTLSSGYWNGATQTTAATTELYAGLQTTFTIPAGSIAAGKKLFFKLINTASPAAENPGIYAVSCDYQAYQDFSY